MSGNYAQWLAKTNKAEFNQVRRQMQQENRLQSATLKEMPIKPATARDPVRCWRSREFLVALYLDDNGFERLSINRTEIQNDGNWKEYITWDEIQRLKDEAGFGDRWAVECYPPQREVINVANMRHIFLLPEAPAFGWRVIQINPEKKGGQA